MIYQSLLVSGAVNTVSQGILWIKAPPKFSKVIVAFAMQNSIAIVDVSTASIVCTLRGHNGRVNSISYIFTNNGDTLEIFSSSEDKVVKVWRHNCSENLNLWTEIETLQGFKSTVTTLSSLESNLGTLLVCSDSSGVIIIWNRKTNSDNFNELQRMQLNSKQLAHNVYLTELPKVEDVEYIALFIGSVDSRVHFYISNLSTIFPPSSNSTNTTTTHNSATINIETNKSIAFFTSIGSLAGHEEWVTCLTSILLNKNTLMIGSGSQDCKIRLWRLTARKQIHKSSSSLPTKQSNLSNIENRVENKVANHVIGTLLEDDLEEEKKTEKKQIENKKHNTEENFKIKNFVINEDENDEPRIQFLTPENILFSIFLDSVLIGHEDWVTSVHWLPLLKNENNKNNNFINNKNNNNNNTYNTLRLFSTSMDRNIVIWKPDTLSGGVWIPTVRVGDIGGSLGGSIGGNLLGFVGGCVSHDGNSMVGIGYGGSFHLWSKFSFEKKKIEVNNNNNNNNNNTKNSGSNITSSISKNTKEVLSNGVINVTDDNIINENNNTDNFDEHNNRNKNNIIVVDDDDDDVDDAKWYPIPFLTGHFGVVNDIDWSSGPQNYTNNFLNNSKLNTNDNNNEKNNIDENNNDNNNNNNEDDFYLISVSSDQTSRLFASLKENIVNNYLSIFKNICFFNDDSDKHNNNNTKNKNSSNYNSIILYKEISRPQIHGYDLNCICSSTSTSINITSTSTSSVESSTVKKEKNELIIYTAGEEKLIRVFDEPLIVIKSLQSLCNFQYFNSNSNNYSNNYLLENNSSNNSFLNDFNNENFKQRFLL
jgi:hypothetical protein